MYDFVKKNENKKGSHLKLSSNEMKGLKRYKEGFKDERFVSLPDTLLDAYAADPLVGNLYLRKIGYFPRVKYHYVLKQQGCDYAMLLYCTEGEGWYCIDGRRYPLRKNQYAVLPPDIPYELGADNENPWTIYWLHFKGRDCRCYCPDGHAPRDIQPGSEQHIAGFQRSGRTSRTGGGC